MFLILLLSLVVYRVTRFIVEDTLFDAPRFWVQDHFEGKGRFRKLFALLIDCQFCCSVWIAGGAVALTDWQTSVPLPVWMWLGTAAGAVVVWRVAEK